MAQRQGGARAGVAAAVARNAQVSQALNDALRGGRGRGCAVPQQVRFLVAAAINSRGMTVRAAGQLYGVSAASAWRFARAARRAVVAQRRGMRARQERAATVAVALHDRRSCRCLQHSGARRGRRPLLSEQRHGGVVCHQLTCIDNTLYLHELRTLLEDRFVRDFRRHIAADGSVQHAFALSTLHHFVTVRLGLTRKRRRTCRVPPAGRTAVNLARRRVFVQHWFGRSASVRLVGSQGEFADQQRWRLDTNEASPEQVFFADETGVNWNTTVRRYGRAPRSHTCYALHAPPPRGRNHSVLLTMSVSCGAIAHRTVVRRRGGTRRVDFCAYLREQVGPAMEASAVRAGVAANAPLYLIIDNASIHCGAMVEQALRTHCARARIVYLPPYAPTMNPIELVNKDLKQFLQRWRDAPPIGNGSLEALIAHAVHSQLCAPAYTPTARAHYRHCGWRR